MSRNSGVNKKISELIGQSTIDDSALITIVSSSGENRKITWADFKIVLGVLGTLAQTGDPAGTAVLDFSGTDFLIRNIEDGPGIQSSVSPQNGVTIEVDIIADNTGVPVYIDTSTDPLIRSLIAGTGINIASTGNTIQISAPGITTASNVVIVNQMSDFPTPVAGVITLANDTGYLVSSNLTTTDRFVSGGNTVVFGSDRFVGSLTYTGAATMFTSIDNSFHVKDLTLSAVSGQMFDVSSSIPGKLFLFDNSTATAKDFGTLSGMAGTRLSNLTLQQTATGFVWSGFAPVFLASGILADVQAGSLFDINTATFDSFACTACFNTLAAGTFFISGTTASGNMTADNLGSVDNCRFFGLGTPLENITPNDAQWQFSGNDHIADTRPDGLLSIDGPLTVAIAAANTPVLINDVADWNVERVSQMVGTTSGRLTYGGIKDVAMPITANIAAEAATGTNKDITFYIAIGGVVVPNSQASTTVSAGAPKNTAIPWQELISPDDFVEVWVENNTDTTDIVVNTGVLRLN
jgi:hypothetical protein